MVRFLLAILLLGTAPASYAREKDTPPDMPFGPISDADVDHLQEFAKANGFDLKGEMARVYCCDKKIDEEALGRVFEFSLSLKAFDQNARTYGQIIFSSLLRIGEVLGVDYYTKILERQSAGVQQRIRDFLFYPYSTLPTQERDEAKEGLRKMYPTLLPENFQFARGDSLFVLRDYPPDFSFTIAQDEKTKDLVVSLANVSKVKQEYFDSLSPPVPQFAFRCQFGRRNPDGSISSLSEELTLNTPKEHNPAPPLQLSVLSPGDKRNGLIRRLSLVPRLRRALSLAPSSANYDVVRFLISVPIDNQLSRFISAKSPFFDLTNYDNEN